MQVRAKTSTERVRAYRARNQVVKTPKPPPKSPAERARAFRQRQKALRAAAAAVKTPLQDLALVTIDGPEIKPEATTSNNASSTVNNEPCVEQPHANTNVDLCKKKWRNIRDSYKKYTREVKIDVDSKKIKRYKYADLLHFINPNMQRGTPGLKKNCSLENQEVIVEDSASEDQNGSYCENEDSDGTTDPNLQEDESRDDEVQTIKSKLAALLNESEEKIKRIRKLDDESRQRKRYDDVKNDEEEIAKRRLKNDEEEKTKRRRINDDDKYKAERWLKTGDDENDTLKQLFLSMYGTVKSFPPTLQAETKIKLFNIIASAELEYLKQKDGIVFNSAHVALQPTPIHTPPVIIHCETESTQPLMTICKTETLLET